MSIRSCVPVPLLLFALTACAGNLARRDALAQGQFFLSSDGAPGHRIICLVLDRHNKDLAGIPLPPRTANTMVFPSVLVTSDPRHAQEILAALVASRKATRLHGMETGSANGGFLLRAIWWRFCFQGTPPRELARNQYALSLNVHSRSIGTHTTVQNNLTIEIAHRRDPGGRTASELPTTTVHHVNLTTQVHTLHTTTVYLVTADSGEVFVALLERL